VNLIFHEQSLLLVKAANGDYIFPDIEQVSNIVVTLSLIEVAGVKLLASLPSRDLIINRPELELVNMRRALNLVPANLVDKIIYAQQIIYYQQQNSFCSVCGNKTLLSADGKWLNCYNCKRDIYPRISPAMIVAVVRDDKLLMAQANHFAPDVWSILAGFSEVGESLEETVAREVMEEVGIKIKNICYWGSQYWPFPNSLMIGFTAKYAGGEIVLDRNEMRAAGFYRKDELPGRPSTNLSIASRMIDAFIDGKII